MKSEVRKSENASELGRELANTPKHTFSAWTTYELPWKMDVGGGVQYVHDRMNSTTTPRKAPGYFLTDAMLAYHINEKFTLRLNGYNLADREYIDRVGGGHFVPGSGRSAVLATEMKF
jgi:catecholate siderophore receptor